jgi:DNA-binding transcriptional LysR family regulator
LRDLLIAGQGIGTLPDFVSNEPEARGESWCVCCPDWELPAPVIFAVTASRLGMDARVTAFHRPSASSSARLTFFNTA